MPESQHPHQQQRYRVIEKLASGGMAEVFRAESAGLEGFKKQVAIKRVLPHLSEKKKFISMFLDEARLSARLNHANIVQTNEVGQTGDSYFISEQFHAQHGTVGAELNARSALNLGCRGDALAVEKDLTCVGRRKAEEDARQFSAPCADQSSLGLPSWTGQASLNTCRRISFPASSKVET